MQITLPTLERSIHSIRGDKNTIKQLIVPGFDLPAVNIELINDQLYVVHQGKRYCFTHQESTLSVGTAYGLLITASPTMARLNAGEIHVKKWLKHPALIEWTTDAIIASWKNNFFFKEEQLAISDLGLRQPQIGAIHMVLGHLTVPLESGIVVLPTGTGKQKLCYLRLLHSHAKDYSLSCLRTHCVIK